MVYNFSEQKSGSGSLQCPAGLPLVIILVTIWLELQAAIILFLSGIQGSEHSCWGKAWHRRSLTKAACRSPQDL